MASTGAELDLQAGDAKWVYPGIEFRIHKNVCEFEMLRKKHGNDEVLTWKEYRRINYRKNNS